MSRERGHESYASTQRWSCDRKGMEQKALEKFTPVDYVQTAALKVWKQHRAARGQTYARCPSSLDSKCPMLFDIGIDFPAVPPPHLHCQQRLSDTSLDDSKDGLLHCHGWYGSCQILREGVLIRSGLVAMFARVTRKPVLRGKAFSSSSCPTRLLCRDAPCSMFHAFAMIPMPSLRIALACVVISHQSILINSPV